MSDSEEGSAPVVQKRGRPPASYAETKDVKEPKKRGRPQSTNKKDNNTAKETIKEVDNGAAVPAKRGRGRPKSTTTVAAPKKPPPPPAKSSSTTGRGRGRPPKVQKKVEPPSDESDDADDDDDDDDDDDAES